MRYIKKIDDNIVEYTGPALGGDKWYINLGYLPYDGDLPVARRDVENGTVIELPEVEAPQKISKLKLMRELKSLGVWETFKSALTDAGYWEEFELAHFLSTTDTAFTAALTALAQFTDGVDVESIIAASLWEE